MPRFFFHLYDDTVVRDEEGVELPDEEAAHANALASARDMACAEVSEGILDLRHRIAVVDEDGNTVEEVTFGVAAGLESDEAAKRMQSHG